MCVVEDVSTYLDMLTVEASAILERLSFLPECKLTLRRLLVLHNLIALQRHPLLLPSLATQTNFFKIHDPAFVFLTLRFQFRVLEMADVHDCSLLFLCFQKTFFCLP